MDREELLRTITSAHRELAQLVVRISDDRLRDPAMGDWKGSTCETKEVRPRLTTAVP